MALEEKIRPLLLYDVTEVATVGISSHLRTGDLSYKDENRSLEEGPCRTETVGLKII